MHIRLLWLCALAVVGCSQSRSRSDPTLLASATIGTKGGVIAVNGGVQDGLELTIPAGALREPTLVSIRDGRLLPVPGATAVVPVPAQPFRLEPLELRLDVPATLRAPFVPEYVAGTAPGNVRARQVRNGVTIDHEPDVVDVVAGWLEVEVRTLSHFQVVEGPRVPNVQGYWPPTSAPVALSGGLVFTAEEVPGGSPFAGATAYRWRIAGNGRDELIYFDDLAMRGRESLGDNWREAWDQRYPTWGHGPGTSPPASFSTIARVSRPIGSLPVAGQMTVYGRWSWTAPREVVDRVLFDIVHLRVLLAWDRADLGTGQREYSFWLAPGIGLVALAEDGIVYERLAF